MLEVVQLMMLVYRKNYFNNILRIWKYLFFLTKQCLMCNYFVCYLDRFRRIKKTSQIFF